MSTTTPTPAVLAHMALASCRESIRAASWSALIASFNLAGARQARAKELGVMLADAQAWVERLAFIVEADVASAAHEAEQ